MDSDCAAPQHDTHPDVRTLAHTGRQMLRTGQDLATRYQRGQIEEARTGLDKIDAFARQVEELLLSLERGLAMSKRARFGLVLRRSRRRLYAF